MDFVIATRLTPEAILPVKETRRSQLLVLFSLHNYVVRPQRRVSIHTGIQLTLPRGTVMNVKIFPDLLDRCSVTSEPRTYDAEYKMELIINVRNYDQLQEFEVSKGDPVGQVWVSKAINPTIIDSMIDKGTPLTSLHIDKMKINNLLPTAVDVYQNLVWELHHHHYQKLINYLL